MTQPAAVESRLRPALPEAGLGAARQAAMQWQVTLWSGEVTPAERAGFERWLGADPIHRKAWQQVQRVGERLAAVPGGLALPVLDSVHAARRVDGRRRAALRGMAWLAGVGVAAYAVQETPQWQVATADYRTRRGGRREVVLPDGSRVILNTATAVDIRFDAHERRVLLREGEVFIATAPDPDGRRPFVLETPEGHVRPLGTRFAVRRNDDAGPAPVAVQVIEGAVELAPREGGARLRVAAGQKAAFGRTRADGLMPADPLEVSWTQGVLTAERMRLSAFIAELDRYRSGVLRCDPAVADLVISGVFPLADTDTVLQSLEQALPVRVRSATRYWVSVTAR